MTTPTEPTPAKRGRGCLFYGCIAGIVCLLVLLGMLLLGLHMGRRMLNEFTDTKPMPVPAVELSQAQLDQVQQRIDNFSDAVNAGRPTPPLTLSADEINGLIATNPKARDLKGKLYLTLDTNQVTAQFSIPLSQLGWHVFRGRYLNGNGTLSLWLENGMLHVNAQSIAVKGKPLPGVYMSKISAQNLAERFNDDPHASVALNRLQEVIVKDGKLVLVPKPAQ